jgi:hypothetical protein
VADLWDRIALEKPPLLFLLGEQAELDGSNDRLGAVRDTELGDDVRYVCLHRGSADPQLSGDLLVGSPQRGMSHYLQLPRRQGFGQLFSMLLWGPVKLHCCLASSASRQSSRMASSWSKGNSPPSTFRTVPKSWSLGASLRT